MKTVKVNAPSSTANLGPGFDVFGLALDAFFDQITLTKKIVVCLLLRLIIFQLM